MKPKKAVTAETSAVPSPRPRRRARGDAVEKETQVPSIVSVRRIANSNGSRGQTDSLVALLRDAHQRDRLKETSTDDHRCVAAATVAAFALVGRGSLLAALEGIGDQLDQQIVEAMKWAKRAGKGPLSSKLRQDLGKAVQRMLHRTKELGVESRLEQWGWKKLSPMNVGAVGGKIPEGHLGLRSAWSDYFVRADDGSHSTAWRLRGDELDPNPRDNGGDFEIYAPPAGITLDAADLQRRLADLADVTIEKQMLYDLADVRYSMGGARLLMALAETSGTTAQLAESVVEDLTSLRARLDAAVDELKSPNASHETMQRIQDICMLSAMRSNFGLCKEDQRRLLETMGVDLAEAGHVDVVEIENVASGVPDTADIPERRVEALADLPPGHAWALADSHAKIFVHLADGRRYMFDSLGLGGERREPGAERQPCLAEISEQDLDAARQSQPSGPLAPYVRPGVALRGFTFALPTRPVVSR